MAKLKKMFVENKKIILLLFLIFCVGVFLRTYKFHDWLRFSKDQSRDAWIVSSAISGENHIPYLGPNAGTTKFRLGPIYYYFSYWSEKIFGDYPDKMAYPSVFFSIMSIPLLYLFMRVFFRQSTSLVITSIMSVSYFMVINSRFSSNPNLITFFILLYLLALLKIISDRKSKWFIWSGLVGLSMGIGIQLHTTLLFTMPVVTFLAYAYLFFKGKGFSGIWKSAAVIFLFVLIPNVTQVYSEIDSRGNNTKLFIKGFMKSSEGDSNLFKSTFLIAACQIQANTHFISLFQDDINCAHVFRKPKGEAIERTIYYVGISISILFSIFGYWYMWKRFRKENGEKKNFLGLILLFNLVSLIILIPIAGIIFVGYFINLFFIPLIMLGLFIETLENKFGRVGKMIIISGVTFLIFASLYRDGMAASRYMGGLENNDKNSTLGEVEKMRDYIFSTSKNASHIYFEGHGNALTSRFYAPLNYFSKIRGIKLERLDLKSSREGKDTDFSAPIYYIEEKELGLDEPGQVRDGHEILGGREFSQQTILILAH